MTSYVYLLRSQNEYCLLKVGVSDSPLSRGRFASYAVKKPCRTVVLFAFKRKEFAYKVERAVKFELRAKCVSGEWFKVSVSDAMAAIRSNSENRIMFEIH